MGLDKYSKKDCNCSGPSASEDIYKSNNIPINTPYNYEDDKIIPVTITKENNKFIILENELLTDDYDSIIEKEEEEVLVMEKPIKQQKEKMDFITQFYIGSLTVVGLFVFYRLMQKSK